MQGEDVRRPAVFVSHTGELARYPVERSFVRAACDAVIKAGGTPVDMMYFAANDSRPAEYDRRRVRECDAVLVLVGFRYGTLAPGERTVSHTELEFEAATEAGLPRLVFLLAEDAAVPRHLVDVDGREVDRFRRRLAHAGLVLKTFRTPGDLAEAVLHALHECGLGGGQPPSGRRRGPAFSALPALPSRYVPRPDLVATARRGLLDGVATRSPVVNLVGMGGAGKSTLARALVADGQTRAAFPDGIVWLDLGPAADLASCQGELATTLGDSRPVTDVVAGKDRLRRLLGGMRCLLVLDSVWHTDQIRAFDVGLPGVGLLVTTRARDVVFEDAFVCAVGPVDEPQARQILAGYSGQDRLPEQADSILRHCGGLALALAIAGAMVGEGRRWSSVDERLRRADLHRLAARFRDYPHPDLLGALDASVSALPAEQRERFLELIVFDGFGPVPAAAVHRLWAAAGLDELDADDLLLLLRRRCLVEHDLRAGTVTLHDLLFDYIRASAGTERVRAVHRRFSDEILDGWGGLACGLPGLAALDGTDPGQRYALTHLVDHLLRAGLDDAVHRLLALPSVPGSGSAARPGPDSGAGAGADNLWHRTFERLGLTSAYLRDVRTAWRSAERATDAASQAGAPAPSVALEVRYALVVGSIVSIPVPLLLALVEQAVWQPHQATAYARAIPDPRERTRALTGLARHLDDAERPPVLAHVLELTRAIGNPYRRAQSLTELAAHLPEPHRAAILDQVLAVCASIGDRYVRVKALVAVAAQCGVGAWESPEGHPGHDRVLLLEQALAVARDIPNSLTRAQALASIAPHLPDEPRRQVAAEARSAAAQLHVTDDPPGHGGANAAGGDGGASAPGAATAAGAAVVASAGPRVLGRVVGLARAIASREDEPAALSDLVPHLPEPQRAEILADALDVARGISDPAWRTRALLALARRYPAGERDAVYEQALDVAHGITDPYRLARSLIQLVPQLAEPRRSAVLAKALDALRAVTDPAQRVKGLLNALPRVAQPDRGSLVAEALAECHRITGPYQRARALLQLVPRLPEPSRPAAFAVALDTLAAVADPAQRVKGLLAALPSAAGPRRAGLLRQAAELAGTIRDPYRLARALTQLAPQLPEPDRAAALARALAAASTINGPYWQVRALAKLVRYLPQPRRDEVLAASLQTARSITDPYRQAQALSTLAGLLPAPLLPRALDAARTMNGPYWQVLALAGLAPHVPAARRPALLATAARLAAGISGPYWQVNALIKLAALHEDTERAAIASRCLAIAATVTDAHRRADALVDLAGLLPPQRRSAVVDAASGITDPASRVHALVRLAPDLPAGQLARAVALTGELSDPALRAKALGELAAHLPAAQRAAALTAALESVGEIADAAQRSRAIAGLLPEPPEPPGPRGSSGSSGSFGLSGSSGRSEPAGPAGHALPAGTLAHAARLADAIEDPYQRARAVLALTPHLDRASRGPRLGLVADLAARIEEPGRRVGVLLDLADQLTDPAARAGCRAEAVTLVGAIADPFAQVRALTRIGARLPGAQRDLVLGHAADLAHSIVDPYQQVEALIGLAPLVGDRELAGMLDLLPSIGSTYGQALLLGGIVPHAGPDLLPRAATMASALTNPAGKVRATTAIVSAPARTACPPRWDGYWRTALHSAASASRQSVLTLLPMAHAALQHTGGPGTIESAIEAIQHAQSWWP